MINENKLEKNYFLNADGSIDPICHALTCFEQIEYFALREYDYNCWNAFSNALSVVYKETEKENIVRIDNIDAANNLFDVKFFGSCSNYYQAIKEKIDSGIILAFSTMFDLLQPYVWYKEDTIGEHKGHMGIIASYDDNYYYIIDNPSVLVKERTNFYKDNPSIFLLPHAMLHKAFEKFFKLATVSVKIDSIHNSDLFNSIEILDKILQKYNKGKITYESNTTIYTGRIAYKRIYKNLLVEDNSYLKNELFTSHIYAHYIMSRHIILWESLLADKQFNTYKNSEKILTKLKCCIKAWEGLKMIVFKNNIKPIYNMKKYLISVLQNAIYLEDDLFVEIEKVLHSQA